MDLQDFGLRLKLLMEKADWNAVTLATEISVTPQAIHKWCAGNDITLPNLHALAGVLGVNWIWLRYGDSAVHQMEQPSPRYDESILEYRRGLIDSLITDDRRHRAVLESFGFAIISMNLITGLRQYCELFCKLTGMPQRRTHNFDLLFELMEPGDVAPCQEALFSTLNSGCRNYVTFRMKARPGIVFEATGKLLPDGEGRALELLIVVKTYYGEETSFKRHFNLLDSFEEKMQA